MSLQKPAWTKDEVTLTVSAFRAVRVQVLHSKSPVCGEAGFYCEGCVPSVDFSDDDDGDDGDLRPQDEELHRLVKEFGSHSWASVSLHYKVSI